MSKRKAVYDPSGRAEKMRIRHDLNRPLLQRLYPSATRAEHTTYLDKLTKIILVEASSTRCVATTLYGIRCHKGITARSFTEAMKMTNELGSDAVDNEHTLLAIAQMVSCRQSRVDHQRQASITVVRWREEAQRADAEALRAKVRVVREVGRRRERYSGEESRVEEIEDEEEDQEDEEDEDEEDEEDEDIDLVVKPVKVVEKARVKARGKHSGQGAYGKAVSKGSGCYGVDEDDEEPDYVKEEVRTPARSIAASYNRSPIPKKGTATRAGQKTPLLDQGRLLEVFAGLSRERSNVLNRL